ncbi:hypothetical protein Dimus_024725, partial [Dionaea muscipula]
MGLVRWSFCGFGGWRSFGESGWVLIDGGGGGFLWALVSSGGVVLSWGGPACFLLVVACVISESIGRRRKVVASSGGSSGGGGGGIGGPGCGGSGYGGGKGGSGNGEAGGPGFDGGFPSSGSGDSLIFGASPVGMGPLAEVDEASASGFVAGSVPSLGACEVAIPLAVVADRGAAFGLDAPLVEDFSDACMDLARGRRRA